ncbi:DNA polymerase alpha subunit B [Lamellibrachia satsuma]|nr:DNA polymerase alpha subunit B [Lamellibrachia satsuma]
MELVVLPSQWDVHHDPVFPQPPFQFGSILERKIHFMSDPCTLNINGVVFGVTSTDILLHLGKEEISSRAGGDRLGRLAQHLITQHSYYPLYPVSVTTPLYPADDEVNVDYELLEQYGSLPATPNVLILPSDLCYFVKASYNP